MFKVCYLKTYVVSSREHTNNIGSEKVIMTNKVIRPVSKYANCISKKSRFSNKSLIKKVVGTELILNFSYIKHKPL